MKPAAFDYQRPDSVEAALDLLARSDNAKLLAGGQTLGPMLNLRLAQPDLIVDITRIAELTRIEIRPDHVTLGACVTHASVEDGRVEDFSGGFLAKVARGIAYRAVRNRGTLGGSIAHADPSADWLSCFMALDAAVTVAGRAGSRVAPMTDFVRGALDCDLRDGELIASIVLPRLSPNARCGYAKICRKEGEFADAIGVYVHDPVRRFERIVAGATGGKPLILDAPEMTATAEMADMLDVLRRMGYSAGRYETQIHAAALHRAVTEAFAT